MAPLNLFFLLVGARKQAISCGHTVRHVVRVRSHLTGNIRVFLKYLAPEFRVKILLRISCSGIAGASYESRRLRPALQYSHVFGQSPNSRGHNNCIPTLQVCKTANIGGSGSSASRRAVLVNGEPLIFLGSAVSEPCMNILWTMLRPHGASCTD
jgi:hypothetical protein